MGPQRKYNGPKNNSTRTMQKFLDAVGEIITKYGYSGLVIKNIAEVSGLRRSQLDHHFGNINNLIETYIRNKDYWVGFTQQVTELIKQHGGNYGRELAESIMINQLDYFYQNREMQQVILWQLCERNPILFRIGEEREQLGERLFNMTDPHFHGTDVDIRAVSALVIAGIYHLVLHSQYNDSLFCGVDISTDQGMERIKRAIRLIMSNTYESARTQKAENSNTQSGRYRATKTPVRDRRRRSYRPSSQIKKR
ncbi:TetR/AcrR family transcriptional regulator [Parapedobacter koreensis]|uniref:DNA-binding transcriptional regulator, AcrR family n=1 Tax=Parapedobacter koreensis TaxID=332977 RepID=A0A1H7FFM0_9SPHI|nr:TetR/AcrR family transcriptional regulator [Parapedobacter koreensis]SEK24778.1 DNA-binding transcriptional regulator, AcrR family [Parapedobacter koreensis]